jgi:hypothetical protein
MDLVQYLSLLYSYWLSTIVHLVMPGLYTKTVLYYMRKVAALLQYVVPPTAAKKNRIGILNGFSSMFIIIIFILAQYYSSIGNARAVH